MKVVQHVPNWADVDAWVADVSTLAELLELPWVKSWERGMQDAPFVGWRRSNDDMGDFCHLMALYGEDESLWWVVARVPKSLVSELPIWRISPCWTRARCAMESRGVERMTPLQRACFDRALRERHTYRLLALAGLDQLREAFLREERLRAQIAELREERERYARTVFNAHE
jgi:hypothetical protein